MFGILGLVLCFPFGIAAWVMANGDLRQMDAGRMDPEGRSMTYAGKVLGIIAVCLAILGVLVWVAWIALFGAMLAGMPH